MTSSAESKPSARATPGSEVVRLRVVKARRSATHLGCVVDRRVAYDVATKVTSEEITLSHPLPLIEVAGTRRPLEIELEADAVFERIARWRR